MKNIRNYITGMIAALVAFSCTPTIDQDGDFLNGVNYNNPENDGGTGGTTLPTTYIKHLSKATTTSNGENVTFTYSYSAGKLTSVTTSDNSISYTISYGGSDNISKIIVKNKDADTGEIITTNYTITYSGGKFSEADGIYTDPLGNDYSQIYTATYTGNKLTKLVTKVSPVTSIPSPIDISQTIQSDISYSGNNISTWKFSTIFPSTPPITLPPIVITYNFSNYDAKINPFATLPEVYNIISMHYGTQFQSFSGISANNYTKENLVTDYGSDSTAFTYTYDSDSYPTKAVSSGGTLTFEYQ